MVKVKVGKSQSPGIRATPGDLILEAEKLFDRLSVGAWNPNVDLRETRDKVTVSVELPGVDPSDVRVTIQNRILHIQGMKREPMNSQKLVCYYCLERSYGRFNREIRLDWVVDARKAHAYLERGLLTIEFPKLGERRERVLEIPVTKR